MDDGEHNISSRLPMDAGAAAMRQTQPGRDAKVPERVSTLDVSDMNSDTADNNPQPGFIWRSRAMDHAVQLADAAAASDACALIEGESGTGKELVAYRIHALSHRSNGPFIPVNCAGISESLFESQFFGHVQGSFTGATRDMQGIARTAEGGTVLLDEVGDIPAGMQAKFLRLLQQREVMPVGCPSPVKVDTRFLAATATPLAELVRQGRFREDLYYRMNIVRIRLPALRERPSDIPLLLDFYSRQTANRDSRDQIEFDEDTVGILSEYPWPGNVRELVAWVERAYITGIEPLPLAHMLWTEYHNDRPDETDTCDPIVSIPEAEKHAIRNAMQQTGGNRTQAAKLLHINRNTLTRKLDQYQIC